MSSMQLRRTEEIKIDCAKKYFSEVNDKLAPQNVKYDVVKDYESLINIVS